MTPGAEADTRFAPATGRWVEGLGRLRDFVRQELVAAQLAEVLDGRREPLRVLDAGCGQGTQALRLAIAGHHVTGLDVSAELLERFAAELESQPADVRRRVRLVRGPVEAAAELTGGGFDVVLCHGVLMYFDDIAPVLAALSGAASGGALMSLLVRNGLAPAMRDGLRGDWSAANAAFGSRRYVNRMGIPAVAHAPADVDGVLEPLGWRRERWFGVRVFADHRDGPAPTGAEAHELLAAEREAGARDPYRSVAALLHLVYSRPT